MASTSVLLQLVNIEYGPMLIRKANGPWLNLPVGFTFWPGEEGPRVAKKTIQLECDMRPW